MKTVLRTNLQMMMMIVYQHLICNMKHAVGIVIGFIVGMEIKACQLGLHDLAAGQESG